MCAAPWVLEHSEFPQLSYLSKLPLLRPLPVPGSLNNTSTRYFKPLPLLSFLNASEARSHRFCPEMGWLFATRRWTRGAELRMNGRVLRCLSLTTNLTKMMKVVENLNYDGICRPVTNESLILALSLTWIMFYFTGPCSDLLPESQPKTYQDRLFKRKMCVSLLSWCAGREVYFLVATGHHSNFQTAYLVWLYAKSERAYGPTYLLNEWTEESINSIVDDSKQDQQIPAEAPLELIVQIFLNLTIKSTTSTT